MNVLISGGGGYIGSVLVRQLIERGHEVTVLDRFFFGREPLEGVNCKIIHDDIRAWKDEWLNGIDAVAHLAGLSNDPTAEYRPDANHEMNVVATETLVKACIRCGVQRFTFASSASIYDNAPTWSGGEVKNENDQVSPRGAYSTSKYDAERIILAAADTDRFCPVILRQGTVFGHSPRMRFDLVVNAFVKDAIVKRELTVHNRGEMFRPLVSVEDAARAHVLALEAWHTQVFRQVFNIVHENAKISDVAWSVAQAGAEYNVKMRLLDDGPAIVRNYRMSGQRIRNALGFEAKQTILACAADMFRKWAGKADSLGDHRHYNIAWMGLLEQVHREQSGFSGIYDLKGSVAA